MSSRTELGSVVETTHGPVQETVVGTPHGPVCQYLGIPYGKPPLGEPVRVVACGGAVMVFKYDIRRTNDVDVISEPFPTELRQATEVVARRRGLAEGWMNDAAKISVPRPQLIESQDVDLAKLE